MKFHLSSIGQVGTNESYRFFHQLVGPDRRSTGTSPAHTCPLPCHHITHSDLSTQSAPPPPRPPAIATGPPSPALRLRLRCLPPNATLSGLRLPAPSTPPDTSLDGPHLPAPSTSDAARCPPRRAFTRRLPTALTSPTASTAQARYGHRSPILKF
jgi:hypothetical protein